MSLDQSSLEAIVAHGSRMSWAGLLRPGDEFPRARKSQLVVLTAKSEYPLKRYFGAWSGRYHRFTVNLTSAKILVRTMVDAQPIGNGIQSILHWVDRNDMLRSDKGGVCYGDGWPPELWNAFTSEIDHLPPGNVAEKLRNFANSTLQENNPIVSEWRARLQGGRIVSPARESMIKQAWIPVPVTLVTVSGLTACIFSWSPTATVFSSLGEALSSTEARQRSPDLQSQARYYLECDLARLHGVRFGPDDLIEDQRYVLTPEVLALREMFTAVERERIANPKFGSFNQPSTKNLD